MWQPAGKVTDFGELIHEKMESCLRSVLAFPGQAGLLMGKKGTKLSVSYGRVTSFIIGKPKERIRPLIANKTLASVSHYTNLSRRKCHTLQHVASHLNDNHCGDASSVEKNKEGSGPNGYWGKSPALLLLGLVDPPQIHPYHCLALVEKMMKTVFILHIQGDVHLGQCWHYSDWWKPKPLMVSFRLGATSPM